MRMLFIARIPHEPFNSLVVEGNAGDQIQKILEDIKPEAVYFTELEGQRAAVMIINIDTPSQVPAIAEPFFLSFNADCEFHIVMSPEDLGQAGLDELGKKWSW